MHYWLIKSEPASYGWGDLVRDGQTVWDGVRNHRAAINLRAMQPGDQALFYHSVTEKQIVGIAEIVRSGFADPRDPDGKWPAVDIRPLKPLARPVTLAEIKAATDLVDIELVRLSRLSVAEIRPAEWARIIDMSET